MLEFKKQILSKVSFDIHLFEKEIKKAVKWLMPHEILELRKWCLKNFKGEHRKVVEKCLVRIDFKSRPFE